MGKEESVALECVIKSKSNLQFKHSLIRHAIEAWCQRNRHRCCHEHTPMIDPAQCWSSQGPMHFLCLKASQNEPGWPWLANVLGDKQELGPQAVTKQPPGTHQSKHVKGERACSISKQVTMAMAIAFIKSEADAGQHGRQQLSASRCCLQSDTVS
jgi:hypothetical protein